MDEIVAFESGGPGSNPGLAKSFFFLFFLFNLVISQNFYNFGSTGRIFKIFTVLEMASKFVGSFSLAKECSMKK